MSPFFSIACRHVAVAQSPRAQALARRGLLHLLAVLVGAGEEIDVVAVEPHEAGDGVGGDRLIGVPDMRRPIRVGDRGGDVEGLLGRHCFIQ
jgi:GNAT superfamily N-acetyltransferase